MAQIRSQSAELIAFFETGDIPTADNFSDFILSTAVYDGTLPLFSGSISSTGSFGYLSLIGNVGSNLTPNVTNNFNLGSETKKWNQLHINDTIFTTTASIDVLSSSMVPITNNIDLGSDSLKFKHVYIQTGSFNLISSSLIPNADNTHDLGASGREWKDLYVDGTAYIDTIDNDSAVHIVTASFDLISSSLFPYADYSYDLGSSGREWKDLYVDGTAYIDTLSLTSLANDINISSISCSAQELIISGTVFPMTDNLYDLGKSGQQWKDLFINGTANIDALAGVATANINSASLDVLTINSNVSSSLIPSADNAFDLGSSVPGLQWKDLYIDGVAHIDTLGAADDDVTNAYIAEAAIETLAASGSYAGNITVSGSLIPGTDDVFDLGSSAKKWKDLYVDGIASIDTLTNATSSNHKIYVSSSLVPLNDDSWDLGTTGQEWRNLFIDGTANLDTAAIGTGSIDRINASLIPTHGSLKNLGSDLFAFGKINALSTSFYDVSSSLIPFANNTYDLGTSVRQWKDLHIDGTANIDTLAAGATTADTLSTSLSASVHLATFNTSGSDAGLVKSAIRFKNLPTSVAEARLIGTGSLYLSGSEQNDSKALFVFTG